MTLPAQPVQIGGPVRDDKPSSRRVPSAQSHLLARSVDEQDVAHKRRRGGRGPPRVGPFRVSGPVVGPEGLAVDLQATEGANQLDVEILRHLHRGLPQRAFTAFTLGIADLSDPAVLERGHHRQQQQRATGNQVHRERTATSEPHRSGV